MRSFNIFLIALILVLALTGKLFTGKHMKKKTTGSVYPQNQKYVFQKLNWSILSNFCPYTGKCKTLFWKHGIC